MSKAYKMRYYMCRMCGRLTKINTHLQFPIYQTCAKCGSQSFRELTEEQYVEFDERWNQK